MNRIAAILWLAVIATLPPSAALGHGLPIHVNGGGALEISAGLATLSVGHVLQGFDYHEDAYLDFGPNNTQFTSLPGFDLTAIEPGSQLSLEVLARPDFTDEATPLRWLWFWDKETQAMGVYRQTTRLSASPRKKVSATCGSPNSRRPRLHPA